ncbi:8-oxo-dGTP diphosphatase [Priestia megaterium]|uniref:NUDIX hydrolase n=1 Tax=Priestia megaterium TaxID=1404 RepID=UPI001B3A25E1|nr:8-oxo-dGTP diphosphatase [Priestia megaterium]MBQ4870294.1 8-oxo-dGTP diphosphatase [Priestia megaterium]
MNFKYTVCFIKRNNQILMLNREKEPIMGIWNGVGGKIEKSEFPEQAALREIWEETTIELDSFISQGVVTWLTPEGKLDGMHVFLGELDNLFTYDTPIKTREGILDWKDIDWILNPNNLGIPQKIPHYLPTLLAHKGNHLFTYDQDKMVHQKL